MAKTPEGIVKDLIKVVLEDFKIYPASKAGAFPPDARGWYNMPVKGAFGAGGIPDFYGGYKGLFWAVEAKEKGKKPTGLQQLQLDAIGMTAGEVFVVDGEESLKKFREWLEGKCH